jgi:enediyne polyketide synthase
VPAGPGEYVWNVEAVDSAGQPLITWTGLRLRDTGPLPHGDPWPLALLAVYLEQSATGLGLHPELRVAVRHRALAGDEPRPNRSRPARPKGAGAVVPKPAPAADDSFAPVGAQSPSAACVTAGTGALAGFELTASAPAPVACSWTVADEPGQPAAGKPGRGGKAGQLSREPGLAGGKRGLAADEPDLAGIQDDMRGRLGEPQAAVSARLAAVSGCLAAAGLRPAEITVADTPANDGWVLLRTSGAAIACTVVQLAGVGSPVAIAIMTGAAEKTGRQPAGASPATAATGRHATAADHPTTAAGRSPATASGKRPPARKAPARKKPKESP